MRPPGFRAVIFGDASIGDVRFSDRAVEALVGAGAPSSYAYANQVHGNAVLEATQPGLVGDGDAIITTRTDLAIVVATADCVPVALEGDGFVAVIHSGWRGAAAGVVSATLRSLDARNLVPERAAIGPAIGPCCYEVGREVVASLSDHVASTDWGTPSVDLTGAVTSVLGTLPTWTSGRCTKTDLAYYSHRRDGTKRRQVAVAWLPSS